MIATSVHINGATDITDLAFMTNRQPVDGQYGFRNSTADLFMWASAGELRAMAHHLEHLANEIEYPLGERPS